MSIEIALRALEKTLEPLERVIRIFSASLGEPTLRKSDNERGFRYEAPDVRHFCLLKAVRALSALNAAIELARQGYTHEIAVLMRTLIECATHIEFVLEVDNTEQHRAVVQKYIAEFFADDHRGPGQFHLHGMNGTPKEGENLEMLQTFAVTLINCFVQMIQGLNLRRLVEADPVIGTWYKKVFEKDGA